MVLWIVVAVMAALAVVSYFKPAWFTKVWETTLAWLAVGVVPVLWDIAEYLTTDMTWTNLLAEFDYKTLALVIAAVLGIIIRRLNTTRD